MKYLFLLFTALLFSYASFATIGPVNGTFSICAGTATTLTDAVTGGTWSSSNTAVATIGSTGTVYGSTAGTTVISYTLGAGTATQVVTVNAAPGPVTGLNTVCAGDSIVLTDAPVGGAWSSGNTAIASISSVAGVVTGVSAGTVLVSYNIGDGCSSAYEITVYPLPSVITGDSVLCMGTTSPLADSDAGGTWSASNTAVASIGGVDGMLFALATGTTVISYTSNVGCLRTEIVTVNPAAAAVAIHATPGDTLCAGQPVTLVATITGTTTIISGQWFRDGSYLATGDTYMYVPDDSDALYFTLKAISACTGDTVTTGSNIILITVNPTPGLTTGGRTSICEGETDTLIAHTTSPASLVWSPVFSISCVACDTVVCDPISTQVFSLIATSAGGCADTALIAVTVNPLPIITVSPDPVFICLDSTVLLTAAGAATYSWLPGTGLSCSNCATPTLTGITNTVYYTRGTTAFGCTDSVIVTVSVDTACTLAVPAISSSEALSIYPNPAHDRLTIASSLQPIIQLQITDLLGRQVFIQTPPANTQQTQVDISGLASGVYFIKINNTTVRKFVKE